VLGDGSVTAHNYRSKAFIEEVKRIRPAAWTAWTPDEDKRLKEETSMGLDLEQIAQMHSRTPNAIWWRLWKWDLEHTFPQPEPGAKAIFYSAISEDPNFINLVKDGSRICLGCGLPPEPFPCHCWTRSNTSEGFTTYP
jgi:hypothetical protein